MTPDAAIVHYAGASSQRRTDREVLVMKAKVTLARRYLPAWQRPLALFLLRMWPLSRKLGGSLAARLTGRAAAAEAARRWGTVWAMRKDWQDGFPARSGQARDVFGKDVR